MNILPIDLPTPEAPRLDWARLDATFPWLRALAGCPQDPVHHAEGDVAVHTRMVCEKMASLPAWQALPVGDRAVALAAALFHDIAKPATTRCDDDGRVTAPGHSRRGELMARRDPRDITLFKSVGHALEDLAGALLALSLHDTPHASSGTS
jgi:putative nucleotidyltransferase with HDIG domain